MVNEFGVTRDVGAWSKVKTSMIRIKIPWLSAVNDHDLCGQK